MLTTSISVRNANVRHGPLVKCLMSYQISTEEPYTLTELVESTLDINNEEKENK